MKIDCVLCRWIGHKWVARLQYSIDGVTYKGVQEYDHCLRCGESRPDMLVMGRETV